MGRLQVPPCGFNNLTVILAGDSHHEAPSSTDAAPAKPHPSKSSRHPPGWIFFVEKDHKSEFVLGIHGLVIAHSWEQTKPEVRFKLQGIPS